MAKIKDGFTVESGGVQSLGSQETQTQLASPTGPRSSARQASSTSLLRQMEKKRV